MTTTSANNSIRAIDKESVHRICSGQVVLDMATAVKELLENSLDAGSTSIVIKFKQDGLDHITVTDNGCGISDANLETLALKHYTSKLRSFNDLERVRSFGFRGEALSSLCALANLTVTTSTGESPTGVLVEYASDGTIRSKTPTAMTKGTVVKISNLFEGMPVRRSELVKNIKREYTKCLGLIQAYGLIATNVRISCVSQMDKKPPTTNFATSGNISIRQNIINIFGPRAMTDLVELDLTLIQGDTGSSALASASNGDVESVTEDEEQKVDITLSGYISSPSFGKGRSSPDRQYIFINGRPCILPKVARAINDVYRSFNTNQSPVFIANLVMPTASYDVNVSPDKRSIFLHNERMLVEMLRTKLTELFEPTRSTFEVAGSGQLTKQPSLTSDLRPSPFEKADKGREVDNEMEQGESSEDDQQRNVTRRPGILPAVNIVPPLSSDPGAQGISATDSPSAVATRLKQTTLENRVSLKRRAEDNDTLDTENELMPLRSTVNRAIESRENQPQRNIRAGSDASTDGSCGILEGYDPLDDSSYWGDEPVSDSEDESNQLLQQRSDELQRITVLDSEVHDDGDREWVEVGFDLEEQRGIRTRRVKIAQHIRGVRNARAAILDERVQSKEMEMEMEQEADTTCDTDLKVDATKDLNSSNDDFKRACTRTFGKNRLRSRQLVNAGLFNTDQASAHECLARNVPKDKFARMKILGQFNDAFIIVRHDRYTQDVKDEKNKQKKDILDNSLAAHNENKNPHGRYRGELISSDIFVLDQHATDEKYNYETLRAKTVLARQRLVLPMTLDLGTLDEHTLSGNMETASKNGFNLEYDSNAPLGNRLKLFTVPVSEDVVFAATDLEDIASQIRDEDEPPQKIQCSKLKALFASRACRRSVMIGRPLDQRYMKVIVRHMGEMDHPWACPHGRPTMRHVKCIVDNFQADGEDYNDDGTLLDMRLTSLEQTTAFDPISRKRPTQHRGSLFNQFISAVGDGDHDASIP